MLGPVLDEADDPPRRGGTEDRAARVVQTVASARLAARLAPVEDRVGGQRLAGVGGISALRPEMELERRRLRGGPERDHLERPVADRTPAEGRLGGVDGI